MTSFLFEVALTLERVLCRQHPSFVTCTSVLSIASVVRCCNTQFHCLHLLRVPACCMFQFACNKCSKSYTAKHQLRGHLFFKHGVGDPYKCRFCDRSDFKNTTEFYRHTPRCRGDDVNRRGYKKNVSAACMIQFFCMWSRSTVGK